MITIRVTELELQARHGVHPHEKEQAQAFVFDIELDVGERGTTDRLSDAVDYREIPKVVQAVSDARSYDLIEALAHDVASALRQRFEPLAVRVTITKPAVKPGVVSVTSSWP